MTKLQKDALSKLANFTCLVRNRAPEGSLRADGVEMTDLADAIMDEDKEAMKRGIKYDWLTS